MTVIVGMLKDGEALLGFDSALTCDTLRIHDRQKKGFRQGRFLVGVAGEAASFSILKYSLNTEFELLENMKSAEQELQLLNSTFLPNLREKLKAQDLTFKEDSVLLVSHFGVYELYNDISVARHGEFAAVGSGGEVALGSLFSSKERPPRERVLLALRAASQYISTVSGPFKILELPEV